MFMLFPLYILKLIYLLFTPLGSYCKSDWAFERSRNKELVGIDHDKVIVEAHTKEECQAACLHHKDFSCLSAEFNYQLNECRLSPYNRFSSTDKAVTLSNSRFVVDYFENNCVRGKVTNPLSGDCIF